MLSRDEALAALTAPDGRFAVITETVGDQALPVFAQRLPHLRAVSEIARRRGDDRTFLVSGERRYGYAHFVDSANGLAHALMHRFDLRPGERVAVLAQNCPEWCLAAIAAINAGAVLVGLNGWWKSEEITYGLNDCGAAILVADAKRLERVSPDLQHCPALRAVVVIDADAGDLPLPGHLASARLDELTAPTVQAPEAPLHEDDPAIILYTSGTTGRPKGAISTHRNVIAGLQLAALNAQAGALAAGPPSQPEGPSRRAPIVSLFTSPLFHVSGCQGILMSGLLTGMTLVLIEGRVTPEKCFAAIEAERVTLWATVPTLVWRACQSPAAAEHDLTSLTRVVFGGSPAAGELQRLVRATFPNAAGGAGTNNYGATETSGVIASLAAEQAAEHPGSVGRPLPTVQVSIRDGSGAELASGQDGEVMVRGAMVTPGYWNRPQESATSLQDGWLASGDIGHVDAEGFLFITDRKKDMIIRGGENVYCLEIEQRLLAHPEVVDAAVIGVPHPELGEEVKAVIQPVTNARLSAEDVRAWVAGALADFKVPAHVQFQDGELPRNAAGKLIKAQLRENEGV